jgi:hypothetical protein
MEHRSERSSHAIYGLIIITSALVADREHVDDPLTALLVVWGAGIVLLLAHLYSAFVGETGSKGRWLSHAERHLLIADNVPVLWSIVVPTVLFTLAGLGAMELAVAIDVSIVAAVLGLFVVGVIQSRQSGAPVATQAAIGVIGVIVGIIVIVLEVALGH